MQCVQCGINPGYTEINVIDILKCPIVPDDINQGLVDTCIFQRDSGRKVDKAAVDRNEQIGLFFDSSASVTTKTVLPNTAPFDLYVLAQRGADFTYLSGFEFLVDLDPRLVLVSTEYFDSPADNLQIFNLATPPEFIVGFNTEAENVKEGNYQLVKLSLFLPEGPDLDDITIRLLPCPSAPCGPAPSWVGSRYTACHQFEKQIPESLYTKMRPGSTAMMR